MFVIWFVKFSVNLKLLFSCGNKKAPKTINVIVIVFKKMNILYFHILNRVFWRLEVDRTEITTLV